MLAPDELTAERAEELLAQPAGAERRSATHPETGREIVARVGRYGPYVTEVLPEGTSEKPRTASLFATMTRETVTLDDAVQLLTLPASLEGSDGEEIVVSNGRYGPFVKKGSETRSLESEEQLLTLTRRGGGGGPRAAEAAPGPRRHRSRRSRSSARIRRAASRSSSRTGGSARTSRTARRTRASAAGTTPRR